MVLQTCNYARISHSFDAELAFETWITTPFIANNGWSEHVVSTSADLTDCEVCHSCE